MYGVHLQCGVYTVHPARTEPHMSPLPTERKTALVTGVLFVITFVSAIAGLALYGPVLDDAGYVLGGGSDTRIALGAFCEIVLVIANIATAVDEAKISGPPTRPSMAIRRGTRPDRYIR